MNIYKRFWRFSKVLIVIIVLWAIWVFGFVWQYYDDNISGIEGGILLGMMALMILLREIVLANLRKEIKDGRKAIEQWRNV